MTLLHRSHVAPNVTIDYVRCLLQLVFHFVAISFMGFGWVVGSLVLVRNLSFV